MSTHPWNKKSYTYTVRRCAVKDCKRKALTGNLHCHTCSGAAYTSDLFDHLRKRGVIT